MLQLCGLVRGRVDGVCAGPHAVAACRRPFVESSTRAVRVWPARATMAPPVQRARLKGEGSVIKRPLSSLSFEASGELLLASKTRTYYVALLPQ